MATGKPLKAKLLLEGIEVPFIGATITHSVNQAAIAYIDLVPHKIINNIKPRTFVQLFVRDYQDTVTGGGFPYVKAFEGEVFGFSFAKTSSSRTFSISCIDITGYWDNVLTYFFNSQQSLGKGSDNLSKVGLNIKDSKAQGIEVKPVTHSVSSYFIKIIKGVLNGGKIGGREPDFLDAFVAVIKDVSKINDFYLSAESRLRIVDRIFLQSSGDLTKLLKSKEALDWFGGIIGRSSGLSTLRSVVQDLMSLIFHDFVSVPFPARIPKPGLPSDSVGLRETDSIKHAPGDFIFKPNMYMFSPPACNIFFPDEYSSFNFSRNFFKEPTRLIYQPEIPRGLGGGIVSLPHVYQPESFDHYMLKKSGSFVDAGLLGDEGLQVNEEFGKIGDTDTNTLSSQTNQGKKREQQFLTNEEKMRGILMSKEGMVPASTQFRQSLTDLGKREFSEGVSKYLFFKKRFEGRSLQISAHLKLSVVPGFPVLVVDDSEAEQTVVAYCHSVTHRIYATQGGYTNTSLSYARTVEEEDTATNKGTELLIPPWFSEEIFGSVTEPSADATEEEKSKGKQVITNTEAMSNYYAGLLGNRGSKVINEVGGNSSTLVGATANILKQYRSARKTGNISSFINKITSRDYIRMREAMRFLGASTNTKDLRNTDFVEFFGDRLAGKAENQNDADQIKLRREIVIKYRNELRKKRGFRG